MDRDPATLVDIISTCRLIGGFIDDASRDDLERDAQLRFALLHGLTVIGEAVKRLSPEFRQAHPEIPWKQIAGMRDRLIHGYDDVNLDHVWDAVTARVPVLLSQLDAVLSPGHDTQPPSPPEVP